MKLVKDIKDLENKYKKVGSEQYELVEKINYFYNSLIHISGTKDYLTDYCLICLNSHSPYINGNYNDIKHDHEKLEGFDISKFYDQYDRYFLRIDGKDNFNIEIHFNKEDGIIFRIRNYEFTLTELLIDTNDYINDGHHVNYCKEKIKTMLHNGEFFNLIINQIYISITKKLKNATGNLGQIQKIHKNVMAIRNILGEIEK